MTPVALTLVGGPTVVLELGALRLVTDPTFDGPGRFPVGTRHLVKTKGPALTPDAVGPVDAVLLSHDQHPDNLDRLGRQLIERVPITFTTRAAAGRLDGNVVGLDPWQSATVLDRCGLRYTITGVPARHGPPGAESLAGPVIGFVVEGPGTPRTYVSGDNASLGLVAQVRARTGRPDLAVLFAGAARTPLMNGANLTLTSEDGVRAAEILDAEHVVVVHTDGWAHFSEDAASVTAAFARTSTADRLVDLQPGVRVPIPWPARPIGSPADPAAESRS